MTEIETRLGRVRGRDADGGHVFLGLPYAAPPTEALRWKSPRPAPPWSGVFDATRWPKRCFQPPYPEMIKINARGEPSEDCLTLNIHTPAADAAKRPVLVWIHGGAYIQGAAHDYDATAIVRKHDVVVVAINYRLGALGFADLSALGPEYVGSGSRGFEDQIAALRWVRDNIADYGGDPGCVTIFGESAGGASVVALQGAASAEGLFHRGVAYSPTDIHPGPAPAAAAALAAHLGDGPDLEARAQALPAAELLQLQLQRRLPVFQSVDGTVITERPVDAIARKGAAGPPLILGTVRGEGSYLAGLAGTAPEIVEATVQGFAPLVRPADPAGYRALVDAAFPGTSGFERLEKVWGDLFRSACLRVAQAASAAGAGGWVYNFEVPTDHELGITHGADIPFTFHLFDFERPVMQPFHAASDANRALADEWLGFLVRFARTGDPRGGGLPEWPRYEASTRACLVFDAAPHVVQQPDAAATLARYEFA